MVHAPAKNHNNTCTVTPTAAPPSQPKTSIKTTTVNPAPSISPTAAPAIAAPSPSETQVVTPPPQLPTPTQGTTPSANGIIRQDKSKRELAAYYAATAFNMRQSIMINAINKTYLDSWPGLTASLISKHLPKSIASTKGHLDQEQKNLQSTKAAIAAEIEEIPKQEINNLKTNHICAALISIDNLPSKSYSDQTGRFPVESSRGNNYIFVLYHYDTNSIHATAIPNRQAATITKAYLDLFDTLKLHGQNPDLHILDNECSKDLRKAFHKNGVAF